MDCHSQFWNWSTRSFQNWIINRRKTWKGWIVKINWERWRNKKVEGDNRKNGGVEKN